MRSSVAKLTKRAVDGTAPRADRYLLWDTELKGFALRVAPTGTKTFILRYRPRGAGGRAPKRFIVLGRYGVISPDEARHKAKVILGAVAAGQDPAKERAEAPTAITLTKLVQLFVDEHVKAKRKPRTAAGYKAVLENHLLPRLGRREAAQITSADMFQLHHAMRETPSQANALMSVIASMYGFAARRGHVPKGTNPVEDVERFRESSRERYLSAEELRRLGETLRLAETDGLPWKTSAREVASKHLAKDVTRRVVLAREIVLAFRLLLFTGARLREILHLEWRFVDMEHGLFLLPDSKTGRKTIVLSEPVLDLLKRLERTSAYVIPGAVSDRPRSDLKKPWAAIKRHARLGDVRIHDLRHTFASIGAGANLGLPIVGKLLGHSQPATTARYAHLDADPVRRATNIIGDHLTNALSQAKPI